MPDPLVRIHIVSIPITNDVDASKELHKVVKQLGGSITEEVITDAGSEKIATIIFDDDLDN